MGLVGMVTSRDVMQGRGMAGAQGWAGEVALGLAGMGVVVGGAGGHGERAPSRPRCQVRTQIVKTIAFILAAGRPATAGPQSRGSAAGRIVLFYLPYSICSDGCTRCCTSVASA